MSYIYNEFLYRPLLNLLFIIYDFVISDIGVAIVIVTLVIRFVLLPIFYKSAKDQTLLQKIAPQIRDLQKKYKDDKETQVKEMMALYKEHKVNPFSSFLLLFLQLPILFALYRVFVNGFSQQTLTLLYSFVPIPAQVHYMFLGIIELDKTNMLLVLLAGAFQYFQSYLLLHVVKRPAPALTEKDSMAETMEKVSRRMVLFTPVLTVVILISLPSAVALYWMTTSAFSLIQQIVINKKIQKHGTA